MKVTLPATGPMWIDARTMSPLTALGWIETALLKGREGARRVIVRVADAEVIDTVRDWAEELEVPFTLQAAASGLELHLYLLPSAFGAHCMAGHANREAAASSLGGSLPLEGRRG